VSQFSGGLRLESAMRFNCLTTAFLACQLTAFAAELPDGVRRVKVLNYPDCFELANGDTRVTLCHQVGGRVLEYSFKGRNALYLDPREEKWGTPGGPKAPSSAGRFDIGPEYLIPKRDKLWAGEWQPEAIGPRAVRLTSQSDDATGVQLIRNFRLAATGTHLVCEQIIRNISKEPKYWTHWSRTFAVHGGIGVIPQTPDTRRFPNGFVMYNQGAEHSIIARPTDPSVPKAEQVPAVELEPHGARKTIPPGGTVSFTEDWYLLEHKFPAAREDIDLERLAAQVERETR
jgi:hypothetical protein